MIDLSGRTALITGGTQGVGAGIAVSLAKAGAHVILHGLQLDSIAKLTLAACRDQGVQAECLTADLTGQTHSACVKLWSEALAICEKLELPPTTLLVNNAGTYCDIDFLEMTAELFERTMQLNVGAGFYLTQQFVRTCLELALEGRVVFTGSINGLLAEPKHVAYDASKGAVAAMVRSLCASLAGRGIRVNSVAPGLVRTPLTAGFLDSDDRIVRWMRLHTPNGDVPDASVCGGAVAFLLSDLANHIHGQTLYIDGGMSAWQQPDFRTETPEIG